MKGAVPEAAHATMLPTIPPQASTDSISFDPTSFTELVQWALTIHTCDAHCREDALLHSDVPVGGKHT